MPLPRPPQVPFWATWIAHTYTVLPTYALPLASAYRARRLYDLLHYFHQLEVGQDALGVIQEVLDWVTCG